VAERHHARDLPRGTSAVTLRTVSA
jgi:hypothetical protein